MSSGNPKTFRQLCLDQQLGELYGELSSPQTLKNPGKKNWALGSFISIFRQGRYRRQEDLAKVLQISKSQLEQIEKGEVPINDDFFKQCCECLDAVSEGQDFLQQWEMEK